MVPVAGRYNLEAAPLKLGAEQFPLPLSLQPVVAQRFAGAAKAAAGAPVMAREELCNYLRSAAGAAQPPLEAVLAQAEVIGDPVVPAAGDSAVLAWLGKAFAAWQADYPLDPLLAKRLRDIQPALALAALCDSSFLTPGAHPLHQALDAIQEAAVGWQEGLGRAGEALHSLVESTVAEALASLDEGAPPAAALAQSAVRSAQRLQARIARLNQRVADVERGQIRAARAKHTAARLLNREIERFPLPALVADFLTGHWFESAQLVLLKWGEESGEWRQFSAASAVLVDAFAPPGQARGRGPGTPVISPDLKRWLLSLQHDEAACEQLLGELEHSCQRLQRGEDIACGFTTPLAVSAAQPATQAALPGVQTGQWFLIRARRGGQLRLQLAMMQAEEQRLLFCNHAGAKVQTLDYRSFAQLLAEDKAIPLAAGASFSRALAAAAGIDSAQALAAHCGDRKAASDTGATPPVKPAGNTGGRGKASAVQPESELFDLSLGTWLGFHDTDPPLLAKLALHDKVRRLLIFVNRKGQELRRLPEAELLELIHQGEVDILESKSNFREQVERARQRRQRVQGE